MEKIKIELLAILKEELKKYINQFNLNFDDINLDALLQKSNEKIDSDFSMPLFILSKKLKKNPIDIGNDLIEKIKSNPAVKGFIDNIFVLNGYLNFLLNKEYLYKKILNDISILYKNGYSLKNFGIRDPKEYSNNIHSRILVEYSSPNIAKQFHIGHLKTTLIGNFIYRLNKFLGYDTIGINHLGDYGTQFGKLIEGYNLFKDEYDFEHTNPIEILNDIYVRISNLANEDEKVLEKCRDNFRRLENKEKEFVEIWQKFVDLSLKEFNKIYDILDIHFDEIRGESAYSNDLENVVKFLDERKLLKDSQGAKIVDLEPDNLGVAIIKKSNGSSVYITRDIATYLYRVKKYDFTKLFYVVATEQILHFKQLFKIMEKAHIDKKYIQGSIHVPYGMVSLPSGKMSTRKGNVIKIEDLLKEAISRTKEIIEKKNPNLTDSEKEEISKEVGIGAIIFSNLSTQLIKDQVFVWDNVLDFTGNSGPYIQYVNVRILSILKELGFNNSNEMEEYIKKYLNMDEANKLNAIDGIEALKLVKKMYEFEDVLILASQKCEPYLLTNYLLDLSKEFNVFYSKNRIIDSKDQKENYIALIILIHQIIVNGMSILGIKMPSKM